jgi:hypothetical protein
MLLYLLQKQRRKALTKGEEIRNREKGHTIKLDSKEKGKKKKERIKEKKIERKKEKKKERKKKRK